MLPGLVLGALAVVALRLWALDADPPRWLPDATVMDEALWADGARGQALFGDWFADDTGNAFLAAPVYNVLVWGAYEALGVGLWATRLVPALASLVLLAIFARIAWRRFGRDGLFATVALSICPFLWAHSRFGLLEVPQTTAIVASFALLFGRPQAGWRRALAAGAVMGIAVGIKPNAATFGVAPLAVAWAVRWWIQRDGPGQLRDAAAAILGGAAALSAVALTVWVPHWDALLDTWRHEGGVGQGSISEHLLRLGFFGSREGYPGSHALWGPLRSAPALTTATWAGAVWTALRLDARTRPIRERLPRWEWPILAWGLIAFAAAELSYQQAARRAVHLMVPMMLLGAHWWIERRDRPGEMNALFEPVRRRWPMRALLWALLTAPLLVGAKPKLSNALVGVVQQWFDQDANRTLVAGAAGLVVLAAWLCGIAALTLSRWAPQRPARRLVLRIAPTTVVLMLIAELLMLGQHLAAPRWTILEAQEHAAALVEDGDVVFGSHASLLFGQRPVRTVRWVRSTGEFYSGPRPNPDAFDRLQPRYIVTAVDPNKRELSYRFVVDNLDPTIDARYEPMAHLHMLTEPAGYPRFVLQLWRRVE